MTQDVQITERHDAIREFYGVPEYLPIEQCKVVGVLTDRDGNPWVFIDPWNEFKAHVHGAVLVTPSAVFGANSARSNNGRMTARSLGRVRKVSSWRVIFSRQSSPAGPGRRIAASTAAPIRIFRRFSSLSSLALACAFSSLSRALCSARRFSSMAIAFARCSRRCSLVISASPPKPVKTMPPIPLVASAPTNGMRYDANLYGRYVWKKR